MIAYISNNTANGMGREDIQAIVVVEEEFELGGEIAHGSSHDTEQDSSR